MVVTEFSVVERGPTFAQLSNTIQLKKIVDPKDRQSIYNIYIDLTLRKMRRFACTIRAQGRLLLN